MPKFLDDIIVSGGKLGIGTTSPGVKLTVDETTTNNLTIAHFKHNQGAVVSDVLLENSAGANNSGVSLNFKTGSSGYGGKVTVLRTNSPSAGDADMTLSSSGGEAVRIQSGGNVGVGTASPGEKVHVYANGSDVALKIEEDAGTHQAKLHLRRGGSDWELINDNHLTIEGEGTERFRINTAGDVGVGTNLPAARLDVWRGSTNGLVAHFSGNNADRGLNISTYQNSNHDAGVILDAVDASHGTLKFQTSSSDALTLDVSQNATFAETITWGGSKGILTYGSDRAILRSSSFLEIQTNGASSPTAAITLDNSQNATFGGDVNLLNNKKLEVGTNGYGKFFNDGSHTYIENYAGEINFRQFTADGAMIFHADNSTGGGNITEYFRVDGENSRVKFSVDTLHLDNKKASFGNSLDLQIYHDGSNSYIQASGTGDIIIEQRNDDKDIVLQSDDGSGGITEYLRLDGSIAKTTVSRPLKFNDNISAEYGTDTDMIMYSSGSHGYIENYTGDLRLINNADNSRIRFQADNGAGGIATYFDMQGGSATHNGSATTALFTQWYDNSRISFGNGHDTQIYHDGTNTNFYHQTGDLYFKQAHPDGDIIFQCDDGSGSIENYIQIDGSEGRTLFNKHVRVNDSVELQVGASADLRIYHDGSNSYISDTGTGNLILASSQTTFQTSGANRFFVKDSGVELVTPLTVGVDNTGHDVVLYGATSGRYLQWDESDDKLLFRDNVKGVFGNASDLQIYHDGSNSYIKDVGTGNLEMWADGAVIIKSGDGTETKALFDTNGSVDLYHDNSKKFETTATGITVTGGWITTAVSVAQANVEHTDNTKSLFGNGNDLEIYHDGGNSYIDETGTGNLYVRGDAQIILSAPSGGEVYAKFIKDGACEFRHNDSTKLATTSAGVTVTGTVSATSYKTGSTTVLQGEADVILGSSGGTGTISLTTHSSVPFKIENDDSISMSPAKIVMTNLPTSDPGTTGQLWNDNGTLKISAGG